MKLYTMILTILCLLGWIGIEPAFAFESTFGGYWRTRMFKQENFSGKKQTPQEELAPETEETESQGPSDFKAIDTRSRIFYTAKFSDHFKFINKFEFEAMWGDSEGGRIGTDGNTFRVKNSYADFNLGPLNNKIGLQAMAMGRGFVFDDDFAGIITSFNTNNISVPLIWVKGYEGYAYDTQKGVNGDNVFDVDYFAISPSFKTPQLFTINPYVLWVTSNNASKWTSTDTFGKLNLYYTGIDVDAKLNLFSLWFTGVYQTGQADVTTQSMIQKDISAYILALGGEMELGPAGLHGEFFYATGDKDRSDQEIRRFYVPKGQSRYWSEIMGYGLFDQQASANAPGDAISNIWAGNIGLTFSPVSNLKLGMDLWHAQLAEKNDLNDKKLGTEFDFKVTYKLLEGLNMDMIAAYLLADDATYKGDNDKNPFELGTQLELKF